MLKSAGFEACPIFSTKKVNVDAFLLPFMDGRFDNMSGVISGVIEDLDLEILRLPLDLTDGIDESFGYILLIVNGELNADFGFDVGERCR